MKTTCKLGRYILIGMQKKLYFILFGLFFLFLQITSFARVTNRGMFWTGADFDGLFSPNSAWHYNGIIQARLSNTRNNLDQLLVGPFVYYDFNNGWAAGLGYDFRPSTASNGSTTFLEQRLWPQVQYRLKVNPRLDLSLRTRVEYRWRDYSAQQSTRLRQRFELTILNVAQNGLDLDLFDEIYFNLNHPSWVNSGAVNENWAFIGLIIPVKKWLAIDTGYLNVYKLRTTENQMDHVFLFMLSMHVPGQIEIPIEVV